MVLIVSEIKFTCPEMICNQHMTIVSTNVIILIRHPSECPNWSFNITSSKSASIIVIVSVRNSVYIQCTYTYSIALPNSCWCNTDRNSAHVPINCSHKYRFSALSGIMSITYLSCSKNQLQQGELGEVTVIVCCCLGQPDVQRWPCFSSVIFSNTDVNKVKCQQTEIIVMLADCLITQYSTSHVTATP